MNIPPANNLLSMLTLERAAPLFCTQKAISGPFTAPGSILLHSKRPSKDRNLKGENGASAVSFSMKQLKRKVSYSLPSLEVSHVPWTCVHETPTKKKSMPQVENMHGFHRLIFFSSVLSAELHRGNKGRQQSDSSPDGGEHSIHYISHRTHMRAHTHTRVHTPRTNQVAL